MRVAISAAFTKGYIAHPYTPAMERVINIEKESGMRRVRSSEKAARALADYLASRDMTQDDYLHLKEEASKPFYMNKSGEIIISAHQLNGMLAQGCQLATASIRLARAEQIRSLLTVSDWETGKSKPDGVWERFVVVTGGPGGKLSNQRALRSNPYIQDFTATGWIEFSEDVLDQEKVQRFFVFCGRDVGVGASRKLGWGRFEVERWQPAGKRGRER
jgi:hypothetical protein